MAVDTAVARKSEGRRWRMALALSLCLHLAVAVCLLAGAARRRSEAVGLPLLVTILPETTPVPAPAPAKVVEPAGTGSATARPNRPATRGRAERATRQAAALSAPLMLVAPHEPSAATDEGPAVPVIAEAPTPPGNSPGQAKGPAAAAQGSEASGMPRIVSPAEGDGQLAIDPNEAKYQVIIPPPLRKPGARFAPLLKLCVRKDGSVADVTVIRPSDPVVDPAIVEKFRLFKFRPYLDHGHPIPFCFFREYRLSVEN